MTEQASAPIDVVILTWNDGDLLHEAVGSALASTGVDVTVIVVDNGSDPPAAVAADDRIVLVRNDHNRGVAPGRNQGVAAGRSPIVCLLDSDARLHAASLATMAGVLEADPSVAVVVPVFTDQAPEASAGAAPTLGRKVARVLGLRDTYAATAPVGGRREVDFGIGACQVFRREAFDEVGGLDESYFYGPEDVDFCLRLRERGWRVVQVEGAPVDHPPRRRNRRLLTRRGLAHARAVARHLWRHRRFRGVAAQARR